jgi:hypothetical protein
LQLFFFKTDNIVTLLYIYTTTNSLFQKGTTGVDWQRETCRGRMGSHNRVSFLSQGTDLGHAQRHMSGSFLCSVSSDVRWLSVLLILLELMTITCSNFIFINNINKININSTQGYYIIYPVSKLHATHYILYSMVIKL